MTLFECLTLGHRNGNRDVPEVGSIGRKAEHVGGIIVVEVLTVQFVYGRIVYDSEANDSRLKRGFLENGPYRFDQGRRVNGKTGLFVG